MRTRGLDIDGIYHTLQKILLGFVLVFCFVTVAGALDVFTSMSIGADDNRVLLFAFEIFFSLQLFLFIRLLFGVAERADKRSRSYVFTAVCFAVMAVIPVILFYNFCPRPLSDSYDDLNAARTIIGEGYFPRTSPHVFEIGSFKNNYFLILVMKEFIVLFDKLGLPDVRSFFALNILFFYAGNVLLFLFIKKARDHRTANKVLCLFALNPLGYLLIFWAYSYAVCYPLIIGTLYLLYLLKHSEKLIRSVIYAALLGALCFLSYKIKITILFPVVAAAVLFFFVTGVRKDLRRWGAAALAFLIIAAPLFFVSGKVEDKYFGEVRDLNLPVWYWISLGSHDYGGAAANEPELAIIDEYGNDNEGRDAAIREFVLGNYRNNGIAGTAALWLRKHIVTWSDGYSSIYLRFKDGDQTSGLYTYLFGYKSDFFVMYCDAYRLVTVIGIVLLALRKKRPGTMDTLLFLTFAGACVFFLIWEVKDLYSAPLIPVMLLLAAGGIDAHILKDRVSERTPWPVLSYAFFVLISALLLVSWGRTEDEYRYDRVRGAGNLRMRYELSSAEHIEQTFGSSGEFNNIRIPVKVSGGDNGSYYEYRITSSGGDVCAAGSYDASSVRKGSVYIELDEALPGGSYTLEIDKVDGTDAYIAGYTLDTYHYDLYDGTLNVDGTDMISDLVMEVSFYRYERYLGSKTLTALVILYLIFSSVICVPYVIRRKDR